MHRMLLPTLTLIMHFLNPSLVESNLAFVRFWRDQEKVFKLHTFWCSARCELDSFQLPEHECNGVSELHAS